MEYICVFSGSSAGARDAYAQAAEALGREIVTRGFGLVYGGASVGLMGVVADAVLDAGGSAIGVIPRALFSREVAHRGLSQLRVVNSMHERKAQMADLANAFVALPGGMGTLEETFEVLTWAQLGIHRKPCGLLNAAGYYDPLVAFLDHAFAERFIHPEHRSLLMVERDASALLDAFRNYRAGAGEALLDGDQT